MGISLLSLPLLSLLLPALSKGSIIYTTIGTSTITAASSAATSSSAASVQYTSDAAFEHSILNTTDNYRTLYNASSLTWNSTLATYASSYASKCIAAHSGGPYGENLAWNYANATAAVDGWGDERSKYNWNSPGFADDTGHFTQLVWKGTTSVGCGRTDCEGSSGNATGWYIVCEYWPPGNVEGEYAHEVGREVRHWVVVGDGEMVRLAQHLADKVNGAVRRTKWSWLAALAAGLTMVTSAVL